MIRCPDPSTRYPIHLGAGCRSAVFAAWVLCSLAWLTLPEAAAATASEIPRVVIVLDASGSMWGQIAGENKIVTARRVLGEVAGRLPDGAELGLVAYGHRRKGDCQDVETILSPAVLDRQQLAAAVAGLEPRGKTPITRALEHTFELVRRGDRPATIVLISDGLETCGGDPCSVVGTANSAGLTFVLHVVGFGLEDENAAQLECAAQAGGGLFFETADGVQLAAALDQALATPPEVPSSGVSIAATSGGELADALIRITDFTGGQRSLGRTYTHPDTNPRFLPLLPGHYRATVSPVGPRGVVAQVLELEITADEVVHHEVDFSAGGLRVKVTRNGVLSDATVRVLEASSGQVAAGRTYAEQKTNPKHLDIAPGRYQVLVGSLEIAGRPETTHDVLVEPGKSAAIEQDFASGELVIHATRGDQLVDTLVVVRKLGARRELTRKRTYTDPRSNPTRFILEPGDYGVEVTEVRRDDRGSRSLELTVTAGETLTRSVDLDQAIN